MRMMTQCESYFLSTSFFNTYLSIGALLQESSGHQWPRGPLRASLLGQALFPPHLLSKIGVSTLLNDKNIDFTLSDKDFLLDHLPYGTVECKWCRVGSGRAGRSLTEWWRAGGDQRRWNQYITTCLSHPWWNQVKPVCPNMFVPPLVKPGETSVSQHVCPTLWYLWPGGLVVRDNMLLLRSTCDLHSTHFDYGWRWTNILYTSLHRNKEVVPHKIVHRWFTVVPFLCLP